MQEYLKQKIIWNASEFNLNKLRQDIVYTTTFYYYGVISTGELVKVREENVKFNEKLLETIKERNKLGSIPIADVYTQQVSVGNAQFCLSKLKTVMKMQKTFLNYLALDIFEDYELVDPYKGRKLITEAYLKNYENWKA